MQGQLQLLKPSLTPWNEQMQSIDGYIAELRAQGSKNFAGFTILPPGGEREVFIQDGTTCYGLIPSRIHLLETMEQLREMIVWRKEGWLRRFLRNPFCLW